MSDVEQPQIYLITPPEIELSHFPTDLARVLDTTEIACIRLSLATRDEDLILR
ncbi:MAG: thiamine phosphate synthase, partial [Marivita sp.]